MQLRVVLGSGIILGALMVIAVVTYASNQEVYLSVDELLTRTAAAGPASNELAAGSRPPTGAQPVPLSGGRRMQVRGVVDYESVQRPAEGLELRFTLRGETGEVPVVFHGVVPDTFEIAESVTVAGRLGPDGTFTADQLFVQCPSKYEAEPPGSVPASRG